MRQIIARLTHGEQRTRDFFKFHLFKISSIRYGYYILSLTLFIVSIVLFLKMNYGSSLFFLFASLMVFVIKIAVTNIMVGRIVKRVDFPVVSYQLIFTDNEITYLDENQKKAYNWDKLIYIYEVKNYMYFYISKNSALILNKYVLDEEKRNELMDIIKSNNVKYKKVKFK